MKLCGKCNKMKDHSEFSRRGLGYQAWCKKCSSANKSEWIKDNRDKVKNNALWSKYRLRQEDYDQMLQRQSYKCSICSEVSPTEVDHNHSCCKGPKSCGKCVRSLLCKRCNILVGHLEINPILTQKALKYIQ